MESNLTSADMSIWENDWYSVYDFTPNDNYKLIPSGDESTLIDKIIPVSCCRYIVFRIFSIELNFFVLLPS